MFSLLRHQVYWWGMWNRLTEGSDRETTEKSAVWEVITHRGFNFHLCRGKKPAGEFTWRGRGGRWMWGCKVNCTAGRWTCQYVTGENVLQEDTEGQTVDRAAYGSSEWGGGRKLGEGQTRRTSELIELRGGGNGLRLLFQELQRNHTSILSKYSEHHICIFPRDFCK